MHLKIFDAAGRVVTTLVDAEQQPGIYNVRWDGRDRNHTTVASGMYFYRIFWSDQRATRRVVFLR